MTNRLAIAGQPTIKTHGQTWSDLLHITTADTLATFRDDFFAGRPAITRNRFAQGTAYYVATELAPDFLAVFLQKICGELSIAPPLKTPVRVEAYVRARGTESFLFLLNHTAKPVQVALKRWKNSVDMLTGQRLGKTVDLAAHGVVILTRSQGQPTRKSAVALS